MITDMSADPLIMAARLIMEAEFTGSGVALIAAGPPPLSTLLQAGTTRRADQQSFPTPVHFAAFSSRVSTETGVAAPGTVQISRYALTVRTVPEPGIVVLLSAAVVGLASRTWRRGRRTARASVQR
jgi:hypothetical protein